LRGIAFGQREGEQREAEQANGREESLHAQLKLPGRASNMGCP
jgi:hypothetical protein